MERKKIKKHLRAVSDARPVSGQDIEWDSVKAGCWICVGNPKTQANCGDSL